MYSDSDEEEENNVNKRKDDKGKGQSSQGPRFQSPKESQVVQALPCAVGAIIDILESVVETAQSVRLGA